MNSRIGYGYDVHALVKGRKLILGGVEIPFEKGLLGHSDADVLIHAICDALLGAAALGDIGVHFPDTDESYKGMNSLTMLSHVGTLLKKNGYAISNIDSTLILEQPKIASHTQKMIENISVALNITPNFISIKATTSEKLGFIGRGEGAAAQAITLIYSINK